MTIEREQANFVDRGSKRVRLEKIKALYWGKSGFSNYVCDDIANRPISAFYKEVE
jgi:hypothetical protein